MVNQALWDHRLIYITNGRLTVIVSSLELISVQGELAHRVLKAFYPLTSKLNTPAQLTKHKHCQRVLQRVAEAGCSSYAREPPMDLPTGLRDHHYIQKLSRNNPLDISSFLRDHSNDPAVAVGLPLLLVQIIYTNMQEFIPKLKDHVLYWLQNLDVTHCNHAFMDEEHNSVIIPDGRIYTIQTI
jgi:hypothetical protein